MRKGNAVGDEILIATYNSKNRTVSDEHLSEIFSAVGARYGYGDVRAEFAALKDFKVRWQRSYNWAVFTVRDYLDRAPDAVLENLAEVLFSKINGQKWEIPVDPKTGKVPEEYLFARFLDISRGSRNGRERNNLIDIGREADMIHEIPDGGFTPQQLVETGWWQAVNESDIEGIDDTGARAFSRELEAAEKKVTEKFGEYLGRISEMFA